MQTVLVELKNKKAFEELQDLEERQMIRIINEADPAFSLALPGDPVSVEDFRKWIRHVENTPTISLTQAKQQWQARKKNLRQLIK